MTLTTLRNKKIFFFYLPVVDLVVITVGCISEINSENVSNVI